jgi:hypothetical protein
MVDLAMVAVVVEREEFYPMVANHARSHQDLRLDL